VRIRSFEYHSAAALSDALEFLNAYGSDTKVLAGGTDLVLALKAKKISPVHILNINDISELDYIRHVDSTVRIGPLVRHARVASDKTILEALPALACATGLIGSWQLRNVGTLGGNLCNASPSADSAPPLLAMDARVIVADSSGQTEISLRDFFVGPRACILKPIQMLKEVVIPVSEKVSYSVYMKLMRKRAVDLALVGVCFYAELDDTGAKVSKVGIGLGGVAPTPIRVPRAEEIFRNVTLQEAMQALPDGAEVAVAATKPISDVRASANYRRDIVRAYVKLAGEQVFRKLIAGVAQL